MKKTFEEAWAEMEAQGYQYGEDALEQVRFGWNLALGVSDPGAQADVQERVGWPETWMSVAHVMARRSYDPRLKVGSIVVAEDNTSVLSLGYNGNAKGMPNVPESLEPGMSGFLHSELNCVIKLDFNFPKKKHMYCTHSCCRACAKVIVNAGISTFVYDQMYRDASGLDILRSCGVEVLSLEQAILKSKQR